MLIAYIRTRSDDARDAYLGCGHVRLRFGYKMVKDKTYLRQAGIRLQDIKITQKGC